MQLNFLTNSIVEVNFVAIDFDFWRTLLQRSAAVEKKCIAKIENGHKNHNHHDDKHLS